MSSPEAGETALGLVGGGGRAAERRRNYQAGLVLDRGQVFGPPE